MIIKPPPRLTNRQMFTKFIETDLWTWLKELSIGLLKLTFQDNFTSFLIKDLLVPAGKEVAIYNQFNKSFPGIIPSTRIIVRQIGDANIIDGPTPWTATTLFLLNPSANDATVSVIFFK